MNHRVDDTPQTGRIVGLLLGYLFFCGAYIWIIESVGMTFPIPWPDEASFLWQAIAFQEHNHLFAPQLNESRDVMWMPPGYALAMGTLFKLTGFSLEIARGISALLVMLSIGGLVLACSRHRAAPWILLLAGLFLLSSRFVLAGNFSRMEAMMMPMVFAGIVLIARRHWYPGLALLALSPLVHPNGLHFCLVAGCYTLWHIFRRDERLLPRRQDLLWVGGVIVAWLAYVLYVAVHWADFVSDMQFQVEFKNTIWLNLGGFQGSVLRPHNLFPLLVIFPGFFLASYPILRSLQLISLSLLSLNLISVGLMYGVFEAAAMWVSSALLVVTVISYGEKWAVSARVLHLLAALVVAFIWIAQVHWGYLERKPVAPDTLAYQSLKARPDIVWLGEAERRIVTDYLRSLEPEPEQRVNVLFLPSGDSLLFHAEEGERLRFLSNTFYERPPDIIIFHLSPAIPQNLVRLQGMYVVHQAGGVEFLNRKEELYYDDKGTRWEVYDLRKNVTAK